ncbi:hypothetical protein PHLCEN_2v6041 [Hermanssonia centrifuga]|uniref:Uncharacterized protein n=1 Tax=Hermanssonia centrifuga TaxID=98765 RepID=A0A2R6P0N1_9APHY|nr:hypothetical protein PHLCEN_2v6041 [Hermanssonia centrifuga]
MVTSVHELAPTDGFPQIIVEALVALVLGTLGATIRTPELREVTWRSEMKKRPLDEVDPRMSFTTFAQRAGILSTPIEDSK